MLHGGQVWKTSETLGCEPGRLIDFSSNLNPYAPSVCPESLLKQNPLSVAAYPPLEYEALARTLAETHETHPDFLIATNGGIEAIYLAARLFCGKSVLLEQPSFSDYARACVAAGAHVVERKTSVRSWGRTTRFRLPERKVDGIFICNPNNPTGSLYTAESILKAARSMPDTLFVIDEAFIEFCEGACSLLSHLDRYNNLIMIRSLTKSWSIPGLRLGFLASSNKIILEQLRAMQPPWSINGIVCAWASEMLTSANIRKLDRSLEKLRKESEWLRNEISKIPGWTPLPAQAPFFLVRVDPSLGDLENLCRHLASRNRILIRLCHSFAGMSRARSIRLATRTRLENKKLLAALRAYRP